eukprot:SAG31_NODE_140_length_22731_cov_10.941410_16_plen_52_part_00
MEAQKSSIPYYWEGMALLLLGLQLCAALKSESISELYENCTADFSTRVNYP